ncbi:hypothetical protein DPEC_G00208740 [Dallia pectoralis]|uniref:Uncharacterized protein n=1 Tax=Dallia pectoralis TaxID=75939 RepID=A0ACC2G5H8_DALPE|nr:hypothetical protein DPEC_G00208740 [Dallia pectoralis]
MQFWTLLQGVTLEEAKKIRLSQYIQWIIQHSHCSPTNMPFISTSTTRHLRCYTSGHHTSITEYPSTKALLHHSVNMKTSTFTVCSEIKVTTSTTSTPSVPPAQAWKFEKDLPPVPHLW